MPAVYAYGRVTTPLCDPLINFMRHFGANSCQVRLYWRFDGRNVMFIMVFTKTFPIASNAIFAAIPGA
ncbi:hypothetical protein BDN70DRAFT_154010 [Pholiota conissans]|uniref:Uncharacterized protein n=1 Tax=Pholiota conissans TaxID=109636 RepID=A0A9P6CRY8_9AGAR|nr:hypothetical protein BDN70DRAFT_154010 [Pholiota conissans]